MSTNLSRRAAADAQLGVRDAVCYTTPRSYDVSRVGVRVAGCVVIIPFFQREDGILRRALASVFAQTLRDFHVLVIDDASPHPARTELAPLSDAQRAMVTIIEQENKGPGGARNAGLNALPDDARFVAFLDSDDEWTPEHLERALGRLTRLEGDCYFETVLAESDFVSYRRFGEVEDPSVVRPVEGEDAVFQIPDLQLMLLEEWWKLLHLSSFVLSATLARQVRFDEYFRTAAEDFLFFFACAATRPAIFASDAVGVRRGRGVNLFEAAVSGTPPALLQFEYSMRALRKVAESGAYRGTRERPRFEARKERTRENALRNVARGLRDGRLEIVPPTLRWLAFDPMILRTAAVLAGRLLVRNRQAEGLPSAIKGGQ